MEAPTRPINRRLFAAVRRTPAYRAVTGAWQRPAIIACSGGVDSLALLVLSVIARDAGRSGPILAVHVDHGMRRESGQEGRFVADVCRALSVPFVQLCCSDGPSGVNGDGLEDRMRTIRYEKLAACALLMNVGQVVTAHTKNDQVETVLMRIFSGSGSSANAGIRREQVLDTAAGELRLLRPLLDITRSELSALLDLIGLPHIEDPSNNDLTLQRNYVRHRLIPVLEELDPGFGAGLLRAVDHARLDAEVVDQLAGETMAGMVYRDQGQLIIARSLITDRHTAVATRIVRALCRELHGGEHRELGQERTAAVVAAASGRTGSTIELPGGLVACIERERIVFRFSEDQ